MSFDYKKYSLENLENWMHDAMSSAEATPQEIYDVIVGVVKDNYYTYKAQAENAYELLALLNGNGVGHLTCDKDDPSPECKKSWYDFWEEPNEEELISKGYFKEDGFWRKPKDKVKKWILPVDDDGIIIFPEGLLEAADIKEGDKFEWIYQGDGSYLMKKITKKEN
jgi:hypothetical protein